MIDTMSNRVLSEAELRKAMWDRVKKRVNEWDIQALMFVAIGAALGKYTPSTQEQAELDALQKVLEEERATYHQEKQENELLKQCIAYEQALARLAQPALDPADYPDVTDADGNTMPNPALVQDQEERAAAQAVVDAVTAEVQSLYDQRHPPEAQA